MDKHERKHIAKWEMYKAKRQEALEREARKQRQDDDIKFLTDLAKNYKPDMTHAVTDMLSGHLSLMETDFVYPLMLHSNGWFWCIKIDHTKLEYTIDVPASVAAIKRWRYINDLTTLIYEFYRTLDRTKLIKEELQFKAHKFRAILNCKIFKEELMMNVWHPRRMEHVLNNYGWSAWENLLGIE